MEVSYEYLNADQVAELQRDASENRTFEYILWGTYGPHMDHPMETRTLIDLDTDHLEAILITQPQVSPRTRASIVELLKLRYEAEFYASRDRTQEMNFFQVLSQLA